MSEAAREKVNQMLSDGNCVREPGEKRRRSLQISFHLCLISNKKEMMEMERESENHVVILAVNSDDVMNTRTIHKRINESMRMMEEKGYRFLVS